MPQENGSARTTTRRTSSPRQQPSSPPAAFLFFPRPFSAAPSTSTLTSARTIYLYGWTTEGTTVVAGGVVAGGEEEAEARVEGLQRELKGTQGELLRVLGACCSCSESSADAKGKGRAHATTPISIHLSSTGHPSFCPSHPSSTTIITFVPPSRSHLQFLSLVPLQLDLNSFSSPLKGGQRAPDEDQKEGAGVLGDKMRKSAKLDFSGPVCVDMADLEQVVDWINLSSHLPALLSPPPPSLRPSPHLFPPVLHLLSPLKHPVRLLRVLAEVVLQITNWEIPLLGGTALMDLSATVQQIDTRLSQTLSWPSQYTLIRHTLDDSVHSADITSLAMGRAHYIQFYNTLWLIANDVIVGTAFTSFFCENSEFIGHCLGDFFQVYTLTALRDLLLWLNDWPGGVKLNFELATIFCDAFLWGTGLWEELIFTPLRPHLPSIVYLLGLSGLLGTTMFISFASDLLSLLTLHLFFFYLMATSIFSWHLSMLGALFNIFRGKKFNVLRNRVEPAAYEVDQLLLGTILFTLAAFLFPTVLAYYLAFAASRASIIAGHAAMETALAFMNHFPLFAVMLRCKDPARLPGGLQFELVDSDGPPSLKMTNSPVGLGGIFFQHVQLSRRLASHYSPIYLLGRLLSGRIVSPIPRVRLRLWVQVDAFTNKKKDTTAAQ